MDAILARRAGPRPTTNRHPVPSRQLDMIATADMRARLEKAVRGLVADNAGLVETGTSRIERHGLAVFLKAAELQRAAWHERALFAPAEIAHLHEEGSTHVFLSARDAQTVLHQGWGERHPLSGGALKGTYRLAPGYVMIYAPRDERELDLVVGIVRAGVRYASEGRAA